MKIINIVSAPKKNAVIVATQCPFCDGPLTLITRPTNYSNEYNWVSNIVAKRERALDVQEFPVLTTYPEVTASKVPSGIPDDIARIYLQAIDNSRRGNIDAAGVMLRKTLEVSIEKFSDASNTKPLALKIRQLSSDGKFPPDLAEWMDEIKGFGNISAHEVSAPKPEELAEIEGFVEMVLRYLFTMPKLLEDRRARKTDISE